MLATKEFTGLFAKARAVFEAGRNAKAQRELRRAELNDLAKKFGFFISQIAPKAVYEFPFASEQFNGRISIENTHYDSQHFAEISILINNPQAGQAGEEPYNQRYFIPYLGTRLLKEENWNGAYVAVPVDEYPATLRLLKDILDYASQAILPQP